MTDNKNGCLPLGGCKENVAVDVNRILDSCRDKDCFEDVKVFLSPFGREIIENAGSVRAKYSKIIAANINTEPVKLNRGFFRVDIRYYVKLVCEACVGLGKSREFDGLAVCDKSVILYGSEGNVSIFKSEMNMANTLSCGCNTTMSTNLPTVAVEVIDPVILNTKIAETCNCCCCCSCEEIPEPISDFFGGGFENNDAGKNLYVSLGFFSVIRIERPGQYIISAREFSVPDKECVMTRPDDPCSAFAKMAFPVNEFYPPSISCASCSGSCAKK